MLSHLNRIHYQISCDDQSDVHRPCVKESHGVRDVHTGARRPFPHFDQCVGFQF